MRKSLYFIAFIASLLIGNYSRSIGGPWATFGSRPEPFLVGSEQETVYQSEHLPLGMDEMRTLIKSGDPSLKQSRADTFVRFIAANSKSKGVASSLALAKDLLNTSTLCQFEHDNLLELSVLVTIDVARGEIDLLESALKDCDGQTVRPISRGAVFSHPSSEVQGLYTALMKLLNAEIQEEQRIRAAIGAAIIAATLKDSSELVQFAAWVKASTKLKLDFDIDIARSVSGLNMEDAIAFCVKRSAGDHKKMAKLTASLSLASRDFVGLIKQIPSEKLDEFLASYSTEVGSERMALAATALPPKEFTSTQQISILRSLLTGGANSALRWLDGIPPSERVDLLNRAYTEKIDLKYWLSLAATTPGVDPKLLAGAFDASAGFLGSDFDPKIIENFPESKRHAAFRTYAFFKALRMIFEQGENIDGILNATPLKQKASLTSDLAQRIAYFPSLASQILSETSIPELKEAIQTQLIAKGTAPFEERKAWIEERLRNKESLETYSEAMNKYLEDASYIDPNSISKIFSITPDSPAKSKAARQLAHLWVRDDAVSASTWIIELPAGSTRDGAMVELVVAASDDLERAFVNASAIDDRTLRTEALSGLAARWKSRNTEYFLGTSGFRVGGE